jgi:hypothetical protein
MPAQTIRIGDRARKLGRTLAAGHALLSGRSNGQ